MKDVYKIINKECKNKYKWDKKNLYFNRDNFENIKYILKPATNNIKLIEKKPLKYLKNSELYIKAINSEQKDLNCTFLERECNVDSKGDLWGCCPGWIRIPFGNILEDENPYNSYRARIIKLSSINNTYCFCNFDKCKFGHVKNGKKEVTEYKCEEYPQWLKISFDRSCNLKCPSCRIEYNTKTSETSNKIADKLIETKWLEKSKIGMAGQGEVFYSPAYRRILFQEINSGTISIFSNGLLFNEENWKLVKNLYNEIDVSISVDAVCSETYSKLRCGNFDVLLKNLKMLGELRKNNEIKYYKLIFVVQKDNYQEIEKFVKLAKELNVDEIEFSKLNNWGTFSNQEYIKKV